MEFTVAVRSLRALHAALIMGCMLFLVVAYQMGPLAPVDEHMLPFFLVAGASSLVLIPASFLVFGRILRSAPFDIAMPEGLARIRTALIIHWAMIEMPCMLNLVLLVMTGSIAHTLLAVSCLAVLVFRAPSASRLLRWAMGQP